MAPKGQVAGLNASNIIAGSRKRGRPDDEPDPASPTANESTPTATATASTRRSAVGTPGLNPGVSSSPVASGSNIASDPEQVTRLGYKLLNIIYHARDVAEEDDPLSLLVEPFLVLPDAQEYADYYQIIKRPLTYEDIRQRLDRREYPTLEQVKHDCEIICQNAKRYNQKDTPIWLKARALHSIIKDVYADLLTTPHSKSTQLDTKPVLLDIDVEGVQPITSNPPSPARSNAPPTTETTQPSVDAQSAAASTGTRRITIKRKSSAAPQTPVTDIPPPAPSQTQPVLPPAPVPKEEEDVSADLDVDAEGEMDAENIGTAPGTPSETPGDKRRRPFGRGKNLKSAMKQWLNEIWELKDDAGESATEFFEELPDRAQLPEYYAIIPHPISLKEINENVVVRKYRAPYAFFTAVRTMIANAKYYNEEGSAIWNDADTIEKHLERKLIPMILAEGFTLDPQDTRSSVLPPGHREGSAMLASPADTKHRSLTPVGAMNASHLNSSNGRLKVKIGSRPSAGPGSAAPALSPSTSSAAESLIGLGVGGAPPSAPGAVPGSFHSPNVPASSMPQHPASTSYFGPPPPTQEGSIPSNGGMAPMVTPAPGTTPSGRPARSTSGMNARHLGTPQTITGQSMAQRLPGAGQSPPPSMQQPHQVPYPGGARSPPGPGHAMPMGRPGYPHPGMGGNQAFRTPSGLSASSATGMRPPVIPPNSTGRFVPPASISSVHREQRQANKINQMTTPMEPSPFQTPIALGENSLKPARDTSIPSFVILSSDSMFPLRKTLQTSSARQFSVNVDRGVEEIQILFRVKDFLPAKEAGAGDHVKQDPSTAMDIDAPDGEADAKGDADESLEAGSVSSTTTFNTGVGGAKTPATFAEAPSRPPSPERYYKPQILTVFNGRYYSPRWATGYPPLPHPHHSDPADVISPKTKKMKEYALLTLPLHPGSNLLEVSLFPAPPNARLERLAAGDMDALEESEYVGDDDGGDASGAPASQPSRTLRGHVNGSSTAGATTAEGDATAAAAVAPNSSAITDENRSSIMQKAQGLLGIGEAYRIWVTRG